MRTVDRRGRTGGSDPRKSKEDEEVDRISDLPDSLLLHILSFLPFRCAVRASLMLRPFRGLWRSLSMLSFEECDFHACRGRSGAGGGEFLNFVNHALALHESPEIHTFRIELDFHASGSTNPEFDGRGVMSNRLDEWIFFTLKKKVKVLDVALDGCGRLLRALPALHYRVPSAVLGSSSLVNLTLKVCNIESLGQIHLKSLQKLSMFDVNLSEEVIQNLVSGSPSLKKVSLSHCHGLQVLKFDRHPSLEELNVCLCVDLEKVDLASSGIKILSVYIVYPLSKIICPNVMTLELDGSINEVNLDWGSSLNDVALYFYHFGGFFEEHEEVKTLVEKFCNIAYVTLGNWIILLFSIWELMYLPCPTFSWKSVTMTLNLAKWHLPGIYYLLENCDFLETLTIYVYPSNAEDIMGGTWNRVRNFDGRSYWNLVEGTFHCLAYHLKNVMVYACVTEPYVIELIEFLLGNALVLEKMVISTKKNFEQTRNGIGIGVQKDSPPDMLLEFSKKVFSLPRISPRAVVHMAVC
ncbi:putative F-box/LRR-repeat protein At3g18150 [Syzygium oleosum]|uniref:putative F-box/LRR-repeat protein At3g18150 n=1 Tax=Syzygium oleosum TaxID=219896 RepID=UPI0024B9E9BF|nr:putative F-box/LRR-repeat protein At3g18150 [Syzygium oleosum]